MSPLRLLPSLPLRLPLRPLPRLRWARLKLLAARCRPCLPLANGVGGVKGVTSSAKECSSQERVAWLAHGLFPPPSRMCCDGSCCPSLSQVPHLS